MLKDLVIRLNDQHAAVAVDEHQVAGWRLQYDWSFHAHRMPGQGRAGLAIVQRF